MKRQYVIYTLAVLLFQSIIGMDLSFAKTTNAKRNFNHRKIPTSQVENLDNGFRVKTKINGNPLINGFRSGHYKLINSSVNLLKKIGFSASGAIVGMLGYEPDTLVYGAKTTYWEFNKAPNQYGFDDLPVEFDHTKRPILLLHGAAGSWNYMGPLALSLKDRGYPVFVINLGLGSPSVVQKEMLFSKIKSIANLYAERNIAFDSVDLVAHSMGANIAMAAVLSSDSTIIDKGTVKASHDGKLSPNPLVGRVVTLANPSEKNDVKLLSRVSKEADIYNVVASYDVIMSHKVRALEKNHIIELDSKHVNIVYHKDIAESICHFVEF